MVSFVTISSRTVLLMRAELLSDNAEISLDWSCVILSIFSRMASCFIEVGALVARIFDFADKLLSPSILLNITVLWAFLKLFANVSLDRAGEQSAADCCWSTLFVVTEELLSQLIELVSDGVSVTV